MISVLLIWTFMAVTVYLAGTAVMNIIHRCAAVRHTEDIMMAGIVAATVYSQVWSIFDGVGIVAVFVFSVLCAVSLICFRHEITERIADFKRRITPLKAFWYVFLILLFAFGTSYGYMHYDSDLYHAQAIHWIESFGVVPGLGNLHSRLAYNSSSFALSALYSFSFVNGQSYHVCAGFMMLILAKVCGEALRPIHIRKDSYVRISDFVRMAAVVYVFGVFCEMVSPESDYFMSAAVLYIFIRWVEQAESGRDDPYVYADLSLLAVWAVTVKLSAAVFIVLAVYPVVLLIRQKRVTSVISYVCTAAIIALPYFIRNILISGWLLYPSTIIDICSADWKIPKGAADYDAREIMSWGRGYTDMAGADAGLREWMSHWFSGLSGYDRVFVCAAAIAVFILIVRTAVMMVHTVKEHIAVDAARVRYTAGIEFASWTAAASFIFWIMTSPLIRYGLVLAMLVSAIVFGQLITEAVLRLDRRHDTASGNHDIGFGTASRDRDSEPDIIERDAEYDIRLAGIVLACFALLISYKTCILVRDNMHKDTSAYIINQQDYGSYSTVSYKIGTLTVYKSIDGDRTGYYDFPSAPYSPDIVMRGSTVRDGFRSK